MTTETNGTLENVTADTDKTLVSPDYLAGSKKGKGVRRMNHRPLMLFGGLVCLAVIGVTYSYYQRVSVAAHAGPQTDMAALTSHAQPPVKPDADMYDPPATPQEEVLSAKVEDAKPVELQQQPVIASTTRVEEPDPAIQRRRLLIQQVEDRRLAKYAEALEADGNVQIKGSSNNRQQGTQQGSLPSGSGEAGQGAQLEMAADEGATQIARPMSNMRGRSEGVGDGNSMVAENRQAEKRAFLSGTPEADLYLQHQRTNAIAPSLEVKAGTVIPGVMISGINSDLPGTIIAQVRQDVYDSATGGNLLIPAGAKLVGTYDSGVTLGQQRALVVWQRLIYPDSSSLSLGNMPGTDMGGYAGFNDKVKNHYLRIFGSGLLLSAFSAGIQLSQPQASNGDNVSASQTMAAALGQQMGMLGMQMAQRNMNIQPTLEIRPGYRFNVMVTKDIILPQWQGHPLAAAQ